MNRLLHWVLIGTFLFAAQGCAPVQAVPVMASSADVVVAVPGGLLAEALRAAVKAYEQASGVTVQVESIGSDLYADQVTAYLLAGRGDFDLVYLSADELPRWASYHALQPLTVLPENQADIQPWLPLVTVGDEVVGLPTQVSAEVLWYRADWFAQASLQPPQTWQEFESVAQYFEEHGEARGAAAAAGLVDGGAGFAPYLTGFCAPRTAWECDRETQRQALVFYRQLVNANGPDGLEDGRDAAAQALRAGQAAMAVLPLTSAPMLLDCTGEAQSCADGQSLLAWAALPGLTGQTGTGSLGAWVVPLRARHPDAGKALAQWLVRAEGAKSWAAGGGLPAHRSAARDPQVIAQFPYLAVLAGIEVYQPGLPPVNNPASLWNAYHAMVHEVAGGADPNARLADFFDLLEQTRRRDSTP